MSRLQILVAVAVHAAVGAAHSPGTALAGGALSKVFSADEIAHCGRIRIPMMTWTPSRILLLGQCRDANSSASSVGDDMIHAKVISKTSTDGGHTWHNYTVLTPISYSHGAVVYDAIRRRVVMQYQFHPSPDPELNSTLFQRFSNDDGLTWSTPKNMNHIMARCDPQAPQQMQVQSAGSKVQTGSGRIIFTGHNGAGQSCVWYTDDGGETYNSTAPFPGNEISVAELSNDGSFLTLNGRGRDPWKPNRTEYYSHDGGKTWSDPRPGKLVDNSQFGCEAALVSTDPPASAPAGSNRTLFWSEPSGEKRTGLKLRCSLDGGRTWPGILPVDGDNAAAYSALLVLPTKKDRLLVVWESDDGFLSTRVGLGWCPGYT